ncbi:MAG: hypothetical protein JRG85_07440 [Deltaproteobacteria bacterium]|nr:hypothetical protein [Deltaproteobacteria bacterium]
MPASSLAADLRAWLGRHPRWVGAFFLFCAYMTFVYMPFDFLLKLLWQDVSQAEEVWFGVMLHGKAAKLTEPLHWIVYAGLTWGLWRERSWAWPAAALYIAQVAIGVLVWNVLYPELGGGWPVGVPALLVFGALAVALWRYGRRVASPSHS